MLTFQIINAIRWGSTTKLPREPEGNAMYPPQSNTDTAEWSQRVNRKEMLMFIGSRRNPSVRRVRSIEIGVIIACLLFAGLSYAEQAWVRGEIRLNVRTGPGTQFRIMGVTETGDGVEILARGDNWTQIRVQDENGKSIEGWIPEGYLRPEPPPTVRLNQAEARLSQLDGELSELRKQSKTLVSQNDLLTGRDGDQQGQIKQLTMENMELKAGARYPEWITGASIFAAGMVLGAMLHRGQSRRQNTRIRL